MSWVKIGIPNKNVDEIKALTDNIKKIEYNKQDGRTYVYVYFDRDYHKNEIIKFDFSIHQSHMYVIDKEDHMLRYSFTPGWFDEIEVKNITVKWNNQNVLKSNCEKEPVDGYLVWTDSLTFGEKLNTSVYYNLDAFEATEEGQVQEDEGDGAGWIILIVIVAVAVIAVVVSVVKRYRDTDPNRGNKNDGNDDNGGSSSTMSEDDRRKEAYRRKYGSK